MLNIDTLTDMLKPAFEKYLPEALKQAMSSTFTETSEAADQLCENFANVVRDVAAAPMAEAIAGAIDYYVRSITIFGTIITTGSPVTQTAVIQSPSAMTNGSVPNSLGIQ